MELNKRINNKNNKGITIVALILTVVLLIIIAGVSVGIGDNAVETTVEADLISELNMVQHAILERYTKASLTKETLPGIDIALSDVETIILTINDKTGNNIELKGKNYKLLDKVALKSLRFSNIKDEYIVNYKTGEVINKTQLVTSSGKALYIYAKDSE